EDAAGLGGGGGSRRIGRTPRVRATRSLKCWRRRRGGAAGAIRNRADLLREMPEMAAGTQIVRTTRMYFSASRLAPVGWDVMPTSRNARGVDLLAYDANAHHFLGFQIKALSKRNPVPLGKSVDALMGDWWIIVAQATTQPVCFVMKPDESHAPGPSWREGRE